jgi:hypothetical protein
LSTLNALTAAQACLHEGEKIAFILQLSVFLTLKSNDLAIGAIHRPSLLRLLFAFLFLNSCA